MSVITIGVVGPKGAGKTQLCTRLTSHRFDSAYKETAEQTNFFLRCFDGHGRDFVLCFEDTEPSEVLRTEIFGQRFWYEVAEFGYDENNEFGKRRYVSEYNPITRNSKRKRDAIFIVFSLASRNSFSEAKELLMQLNMRLGFNVQGWKKIPITIVLVGNQSDAVSNMREVSPEDVAECLKAFTHDITIDPETNQLLCHVKYIEVSARMGTNCDLLIKHILDTIPGRPSKAQINTPDKLGIWTSLLRKFEWARQVYQVYDEYSIIYTRARDAVVGFLKPIFSLDWLPKFDIRVPVPSWMKIFPNKMWFCFCLRQDAENQSDDEEDVLLEAGGAGAMSADDESAGTVSD